MLSKDTQGERKLFLVSIKLYHYHYLKYFHLQSDLEDFVFKLYDINEDGQIGFLEFLMMMTIVNEGSVEQKVTQLFR